eukprot:11359057-Prorocentrum_lima.AAC.1
MQERAFPCGPMEQGGPKGVGNRVRLSVDQRKKARCSWASFKKSLCHINSVLRFKSTVSPLIPQRPKGCLRETKPLLNRAL